MPAPTLRSLARDLGLSRTTVSDALRGSPRVDPRTAERVRKAAEAAGYRRNPLAGALMSELRRSRGSAFRGVIAGVDFTEPDRPREGAPYHRELVAGISARAGELGFKLEQFNVGAGELSVSRLDSILHTRGITGLVLLPAWSEPDLSALDWSRLAGVYTDYIIERPRLHTVCSDQYRSLLAALHQLREMGYRGRDCCCSGIRTSVCNTAGARPSAPSRKIRAETRRCRRSSSTATTAPPSRAGSAITNLMSCSATTARRSAGWKAAAPRFPPPTASSASTST
ncbi:MAG: LacI family DNA-binding transcriptional regulator [Opitutaceae bacterium]